MDTAARKTSDKHSLCPSNLRGLSDKCDCVKGIYLCTVLMCAGYLGLYATRVIFFCVLAAQAFSLRLIAFTKYRGDTEGCGWRAYLCCV